MMLFRFSIIIIIIITLNFVLLSSDTIKVYLQSVFFKSEIYNLKGIQKYIKKDFIILPSSHEYQTYTKNIFKLIYFWRIEATDKVTLKLLSTTEPIFIDVAKNNYIYDTCVKNKDECAKSSSGKLKESKAFGIFSSSGLFILHIKKENLYFQTLEDAFPYLNITIKGK